MEKLFKLFRKQYYVIKENTKIEIIQENSKRVYVKVPDFTQSFDEQTIKYCLLTVGFCISRDSELRMFE
jgi:hypothetical protein